MESVRGDVARIKAQMVHDKSKQDHEEHGDRKIAMPKGRAGRFSDVHMAEFKKMDSIAGHASAFRVLLVASSLLPRPSSDLNPKRSLTSRRAKTHLPLGLPRRTRPCLLLLLPHR